MSPPACCLFSAHYFILGYSDVEHMPLTSYALSAFLPLCGYPDNLWECGHTQKFLAIQYMIIFYFSKILPYCTSNYGSYTLFHPPSMLVSPVWSTLNHIRQFLQYDWWYLEFALTLKSHRQSDAMNFELYTVNIMLLFSACAYQDNSKHTYALNVQF